VGEKGVRDESRPALILANVIDALYTKCSHKVARTRYATRVLVDEVLGGVGGDE